MNLQLLDPFHLDYPDCIESVLSDCEAACVAFNKAGSLLAAGSLKGDCCVWDFDTQGVARRLCAHEEKVTSVSWSRSGRFLLSSSTDGSCRYWDLLDGSCRDTVHFPAAVLTAQMHPRNNSQFIAVVHQHKPVLIDISSGSVERIDVLPEVAETKTDASPAGRPRSAGNIGHATYACFDRRGRRLAVGTVRGYLILVDLQKRAITWQSKIGSAAVKHIRFSRRGRHFVVNGHDRVLRTFALDEDDEAAVPRPEVRFQDLVNRCQWNGCCFSSDGDFVIGGSAKQGQHNMYIWERESGNLVKILEGPKEGLEALDWHPVRPIIATVSNRKGLVYIWANRYQESWSAFAPDFVELEENVEYEEREDEFDILPEKEPRKSSQASDEDEDVDVVTRDRPVFADYESDGFSEEFFVPVAPEDEEDDEDDDEEGEKDAGGQEEPAEGAKKTTPREANTEEQAAAVRVGTTDDDIDVERDDEPSRVVARIDG